MNSAIFREYDIRGVADRDLDDDLVADLGRAIGAMVRAATPRPAGGGTRPGSRSAATAGCTSPRLLAALVAGLTDAGVDVIDIGVVPTPVLYFAAVPLTPADGAVMITGSHNPPEDNGFKIMRGRETHPRRGRSARCAQASHRARRRQSPRTPSAARSMERDVIAGLPRARASARLAARAAPASRSWSTPATAPAARPRSRSTAALGFEVVPLYCEMDGRFPNHHPDPTVAENVADLHRGGAGTRRRARHRARRRRRSDRRGRRQRPHPVGRPADDPLRPRDPRARARARRFVGEVKCSQALYDELAQAGGQADHVEGRPLADQGAR